MNQQEFGDGAKQEEPSQSMEEQTGETPDDNEPFDEDFPCIRCGYNLRGLRPDGNCPECGASIRKSLNFALERVLCLACMHPVHPSIPKCPNCGAPMNAAAGMANYWQITPRAVARRDPSAKREPEKPFPGYIVAWTLGALPAVYCYLLAMIAFSRVPHSGNAAPRWEMLYFGLGFALTGTVLLAPGFILRRVYRRRLVAYQKEMEKLRNADSGGPAGENATAGPLVPPLPPSPAIAWFVCGMPAIFFFFLAATVGPDEPELIGLFLVAGLLLLLPAIRATWKYKRAWRQRKRKIAAMLKEGEANRTGAGV